jgi:pilus assembly protein CpaC
MNNCIRTAIAVFMLITVLLAGTLPAAANETLQVAASQSRIVSFNGVQKVAVANPEIADVVVVSGSEILVVGKAPGSTTLHVWAMGGRKTYNIEVAADDAPVAAEIKKLLGYSDVRVGKINKTIILEGSVLDQYQKNRAEQIAGAYGDKVVNLLELKKPVQVKIEAKVIEIDRSKTQRLGIKWGNSPETSTGGFNFGQSLTNALNNNAFGKLGTYGEINAHLDALIKEGGAKILSQPNMIALSGEKANIMVGGEIPIPVALDDNKITIEWKAYGIKLEIEPSVNGDRLINSTVKAEVSSLSWNDEHRIELGGGFKIPPLQMRKAETAVALSSGQTMAIGGLISRETAKDVYKVPLLANIPVLGKLFKSTAFSRGETELLIIITPTIIDPAEYIPAMTPEMKSFKQENPWGGTNYAGKDQSVHR